MHGAQCREAFGHDGYGNTGLKTRMLRARGDQRFIDVFPPFFAEALLDDSEHSRRQQSSEIESLDPLHDHHPNTVTIKEILNHQQVFVLDPSDAGCNLGLPTHV